CVVLGATLTWPAGDRPAAVAGRAEAALGAGAAPASPPRARIIFVLDLMIAALLPVFALAGASAVVRTLTAGKGRLAFDVLTAGAALLPAGLVTPPAALLGPGHPFTVAALYLAAGCLGILILNAGFTQVARLSDRGAAVAVP